MNYLQFDFETENSDQSEQLIALLSDQSFEGFEENENILHAFIPENKFDEKGFLQIIDIFPSLIYASSIIENINWNKRWEDGFQPVIVENKVALRAGFHPPIKNIEHEIIITPKMSFGTGHHATTYMMIQLMLSADFKNKHVIDFGTGTGVLAIFAEKSGAADILAIDYDEWSIENTKENILQNNCTKISVEQASEFPTSNNYDIILANITLNVIIANMVFMAKSSEKSTKILLSGFLKADENNLTVILEQYEYKLITILQRGDWIAILAEKL
jgi:ribosomal protein L11 methyltransferase